MTNLLAGTEASPRGRGWVFLAMGFRPFFLMAALHAVALVPIWLLALRGNAGAFAFDPVLWHAHEMVYGFCVAVIAGFLLTAVRNWTGGMRTADGASLAGLVLLWLAARVALLPAVPAPLPLIALLALAFLPALAWFIGRPLVRAGSRRNYKILGILFALWVGQLILMAHAFGLPAGGELAAGALRAATLVVVLLCLVISGRIIPLFTANATGLRGLRTWPAADRPAMVGVVALILLTLAGVVHPAVHVLALLTGVALLARMRFWGTFHVSDNPLLWILHIGHAWIAFGFLLQGLVLLDVPLAASAALHALAFGGIGSLILGMMSRVTLGHTGRTLRAPRLMTVAFVLFTLGAATRVLAPLLLPGSYLHLLEGAGMLWILSFLLYLVVQGPMLLRPRPDGRPG